ncbi:MAG: SsrA-binding protein SmpB [Christensenellaceae bacterium]
MKVIAENKSARFEYFIEEVYEAGIELTGSEVKSIRLGNVSLKDSYCSENCGSIFIKNMHVAEYNKACSFSAAETKRDRRLLLHKSQINRLVAKTQQKGWTIVPLKLYFSKALIKVEIGLCRGKHLYDKRQQAMEKDLDRQTERDIKNYFR